MSYAVPHTTVWTEIPVTDLARAKVFYAAVLGAALTDQPMGPYPTAVFPKATEQSVAGHLYVGKPAAPGTGPTVHLAVQDRLEDALARVVPAGGEVVSEIIAIPDGRFAYCLDPDGNSFGLFAFGD